MFNAGLTGLEPATFSVTGRRANQLRYSPKTHKRTRDLPAPAGRANQLRYSPRLASCACILYNSPCLRGDSDFQ